MNAASGKLTWVRADRKNPGAPGVIALIRKLADEHPQARVIHLVLDNYKIHDSKATRAAVAAPGRQSEASFPPALQPPGQPDRADLARSARQRDPQPPM
jgi:hypothetical protein